MNLGLATSKQRAQDRSAWQKLVATTLSTPWMQAHLETIMCKFGRNLAICLQEEAIFVPTQKSK